MSTDAPSKPMNAWRLWLLALMLWLVVAAVTSLALWQLRRNALESQGREMDLLAMALTDEVERGLRGAEEGLQALSLELDQRPLAPTGGDASQALKTRADLMPLVTRLWLLDPAGEVIAASEAASLPDVGSFAPELKSLAAGSLALSRPFIEAAHRESMVALAFRVGAAAGKAGGWIIGDVPTAKLLGAFGAALPLADARMAIYRDDGVSLAGANAGNPHVDEARVARRLAERPSLELRRFSDGSERLVGLHSVPRYGLKVVVSRRLSAVLSGWRGSVDLAVGALVVLLAILAAAVHLATRAEQRRLLAQQALQSQLTRTSKLQALGTLAGGVAHDFNNVLAGIVGYGEMAQDAAVPGSEQARHLDKVLQAADRGKALIERILSFSRGGARASAVFELEPVVDEVLGLLSASLRPGVVLERALEAPGARLRGDATQAFEVLMNLCTNAMQAMPGGGVLSVQLARERVAAPRVLSHSALPPGDYLALSVSDQGAGIAPGVMEHLFEPFFTTRAAQSGTGLGLAVVFGVVSELGGSIHVDSRPGRGACFTLYLPECSDAAAAPKLGSSTLPAGAGQRLLVVDDEPELVALAEEMLRGLGYLPVGFCDAEAALQALIEAPDRFAAIIADEVMPGLSGTQLTQALRAHSPELPVLLVSGYGGAALAQRAAAAGVTRLLTKPLKRADLAQVLAEVLR